MTESSQHGIGVLENDLNDNNWSLGQSFLFTVTVVTTVGTFLFKLHTYLPPLIVYMMSFPIFRLRTYCSVDLRRQTLLHIFCGTWNTFHVSIFVRQCSTASVSDFETSDMADVGKIRQNDVSIWNSIDSPFIFSYHGWLTCTTFISL